MGQPVLLQDRFDGGFKKDFSRDQLPKNALWECVDFIPGLGAPLRKRGGWSYQGNALDTIYASSTVPRRVFWAAFDEGIDYAGNQVLAWEGGGHLLDVTNGADRGATEVPLHTPTFFREYVIWGHSNNGLSPRKYDGSTISALGGWDAASGARCSAVWHDRLLLSGRANNDTTFASVYFSAPGNPESWDSTNSTVQTNGPINGLAVLRNAIIVFHPGSVEKITGDIPPSLGIPGNLARSNLFDSVGLYEPNAFAVQDDFVVWADESGVYRTDGVSFTDLTEQGGIKSYWESLFSAFTVGNLAVGLWRGYVFVSLSESDDDSIAFLVYDLREKAWLVFSNFVCRNFAVRYAATDELYFSNRLTKYVGKMSTIFSPSSTVKNDANGTAVTPQFSTGYYQTTKYGKRIRRAYLSYDMRDSASDNPTLTVTYIDQPEDVSYVTPASPTLSETTKQERKRLAISARMRGIGLRFVQSNASSDSRIHSIEAEIMGGDGSRSQ